MAPGSQAHQPLLRIAVPGGGCPIWTVRRQVATKITTSPGGRVFRRQKGFNQKHRGCTMDHQAVRRSNGVMLW